MRAVGRGQCQFFKRVLVIVLFLQVIGSVSPLPQRGNVQFPSNPSRPPPPPPQNIFPNPSINGVVPIVENGNSDGNKDNPIPNEFQVGTTGIPCDQPGTFVKAPDGCNRCYCAENRQLSSACSRVFCPPGFPSSSQGQYRL